MPAFFEANPKKKNLLVAVNGKEFDEFKTVLKRAMNVWDTMPKWVSELSDDMEKDPIPQPQNRVVNGENS